MSRILSLLLVLVLLANIIVSASGQKYDSLGSNVAWCGATTATSTRCVLSALPPSSPPTLAFLTRSDAPSPGEWTGVSLLPLRKSDLHPSSPTPLPQYLSLSFSSLTPDTEYTLYTLPLPALSPPTLPRALEVLAQAEGAVWKAASVATISTFPPQNKASSFSFAAASCASTGSSHGVFDEISRKDPLFFLHMGDIHYKDINDPVPSRYGSALRQVFASQTQAGLYASTSVVYMYDDHDFAGNSVRGEHPVRATAMAHYLASAPHYPLASRDAHTLAHVLPPSNLEVGLNASASLLQIPPSAVSNSSLDGLYHSFVVGRVLFAVTDTRSAGIGPSLLGPKQREWLISIFARAHTYALVVWVSPSGWIGSSVQGEDSWRGAGGEREILSNALAEHNVTNLVMIHGDSHMVAIDSGIHANYANLTAYPGSAGGGFPILAAAPLDRIGSTKGGPYSHGCYGFRLWKTHQYGTIEVQDEEDGETCISLAGHRFAEDDPLVSLRMCTPFVYPGGAGGGQGASGSCTMSWLPLWVWISSIAVCIVTAALVTLVCITVYRLRAGWSDSALAKANADSPPTFRADAIALDHLLLGDTDVDASVERSKSRLRQQRSKSQRKQKMPRRRTRRRRRRRRNPNLSPRERDLDLDLDPVTPFNPYQNPTWLSVIPSRSAHPRLPRAPPITPAAPRPPSRVDRPTTVPEYSYYSYYDEVYESYSDGSGSGSGDLLVVSHVPGIVADHDVTSADRSHSSYYSSYLSNVSISS